MKKVEVKKRKAVEVTVLIAAKNEGAGLMEIIRSIRPYADEIILVDGNSTDNTKEIAQKEHVRFFLDHGKGRGDALQIGIKESEGSIIVFFDADGSHEASDIPHLIEAIKKGADLAICSRRTGGSFDAEITVSGMIRSVGADVLTYLLNKRFNTHFTDIIYSFRAMKAASAKKLPLTAEGFTVEQEMVALACYHHYTVVEIPSREKARGWGESKLKTIAGIKLFGSLAKLLFIDLQEQ